MESGWFSDATLVEAARSGDGREFAALFRRHVSIVRGVVAQNVRDADDRADCVQEVFARAIEDLPRLREPERFRAWLLSIARHVAIDRRRQFQRDQERTTDDEGDDLPTSGRSPALEFEVTELGRTVRSSLATLSPRDATALAMVTYLDFGPAEIAAALGVSNTNAKVIVHRARRRLRDALVLEVRFRQGIDCETLHVVDLVGDPRSTESHIGGCEDCQRQAQRVLSVG